MNFCLEGDVNAHLHLRQNAQQTVVTETFSATKPAAPDGFDWAPGPGGTPWPFRKQYSNENCTAQFWYGVAFCGMGTKKSVEMNFKRFEIGFGCPAGQRVRIELTGTTSSIRNKCLPFFVDQEAEMRKFVARATADSANGLYQAYNKVVFGASKPDFEDQTDFVSLGSTRQMVLRTGMCKVLLQVHVGVCDALPKVYIPVRLEHGKRLTATHVGCGCGGQLVDIQYKGNIVWMKDQYAETQDICADLELSFMNEAKIILQTNMNEKQEVRYMADDDRLSLQWLRDRLVKQTVHELQNTCFELKKQRWKPSALAANEKEVAKKVQADEDKASAGMLEGFSKKEQEWWHSEISQKQNEWTHEKINKNDQWVQEKTQKYEHEQKLLREIAAETNNKEVRTKKFESKWAKKEKVAKKAMATATSKHAKEASSKASAHAKREFMETKQKNKRKLRESEAVAQQNKEAAAQYKADVAKRVEAERAEQTEKVRRKETAAKAQQKLENELQTKEEAERLKQERMKQEQEANAKGLERTKQAADHKNSGADKHTHKNQEEKKEKHRKKQEEENEESHKKNEETHEKNEERQHKATKEKEHKIRKHMQLKTKLQSKIHALQQSMTLEDSVSNMNATISVYEEHLKLLNSQMKEAVDGPMPQ